MSTWQVWIAGELSDAHEEMCATAVESAKAQSGRVDVFLDSPGGRLDLALRIARYLSEKSVEVRTHGCAHVDSAAIAVFCAGTQRICNESTLFAFHPVYRELSGFFDSREMECVRRAILHEEADYAAFLAERTGKKAMTWRSLMRRRSVVSANKALALGLLTSIVAGDSASGDFTPNIGGGNESGMVGRFKVIAQ